MKKSSILYQLLQDNLKNSWESRGKYIQSKEYIIKVFKEAARIFPYKCYPLHTVCSNIPDRLYYIQLKVNNITLLDYNKVELCNLLEIQNELILLDIIQGVSRNYLHISETTIKNLLENHKKCLKQYNQDFYDLIYTFAAIESENIIVISGLEIKQKYTGNIVPETVMGRIMIKDNEIEVFVDGKNNVYKKITMDVDKLPEGCKLKITNEIEEMMRWVKQ